MYWKLNLSNEKKSEEDLREISSLILKGFTSGKTSDNGVYWTFFSKIDGIDTNPSESELEYISHKVSSGFSEGLI